MSFPFKEICYVVMGGCGEYSDRREWPVAVYTDEALAKEHAAKAEARALELFHWEDEHGNPWRYTYDSKTKPVNEYDLGMMQDYDGTDYWVSSGVPAY